MEEAWILWCFLSMESWWKCGCRWQIVQRRRCLIDRLTLFLCLYFLWLVYSAPLWTAGGYDRTGKKKKGTAHSGHFFTAAISKFIETDWFLQIIVKLISSTKHEVRKRLRRPAGQPQHQNRRLMVGCKNVSWSVLSTEKKKSAQEHLNLPENKTGVKTGQFFLII